VKEAAPNVFLEVAGLPPPFSFEFTIAFNAGRAIFPVTAVLSLIPFMELQMLIGDVYSVLGIDINTFIYQVNARIFPCNDKVYVTVTS